MKKTMLLALIGGWLLAPNAMAADFKKDTGDYRRATITMCAQLQAGKPLESKNQLLAEIEALDAQWEKISQKYADAPPEAYRNDPAWKSYFIQVKENSSVVKSFVAREKYKSAVRFCGMSCKLFVTMDETSRVVALSNQLFLLRDAAKIMKARAVAANVKGAVAKAESFRKALSAIKGGEWKNAKDEKTLALIAASEDFHRCITSGRFAKEEADKKFSAFMNAFAPVYYDSL